MALVRPISCTLCVFGTGVQGAAQVDYALRTLPGLDAIRYLAFDGLRDLRFEAVFAARCSVAPGAAPNVTVAASDIVITATPGPAALFDTDAVRAGTHLNCVGSGTCGKRELPQGLLARAWVWVDDLAQSRSVGELHWAADTPAQQIGSLLSGAEFARAPGDITLFDLPVGNGWRPAAGRCRRRAPTHAA